MYDKNLIKAVVSNLKYSKAKEWKELLGQEIIQIALDTVTDCRRLILVLKNGDCVVMQGDPDEMSCVRLEDIAGDWADILNQEILQAEEAVSKTKDGDGSATWSFYKLATIKGSITLRWCGSSNGYYSESVDLHFLTARQIQQGAKA